MSLEAAALAASGLMPTRQLDKAELCAAVQQAMGVLNDRQRMAVLLAKFEHFSYAEIGEVMDMSPQAIKSLLSRARCNLREALQPYLERGAKINGAVIETVADSHYPDAGNQKRRFARDVHDQIMSTTNDPQPESPARPTLLGRAGRVSRRRALARRVPAASKSGSPAMPITAQQLRDLDQAWEALDALPATSPGDDFARTTIEMVTLAAQEDQQQRTGRGRRDNPPSATAVGDRRRRGRCRQFRRRPAAAARLPTPGCSPICPSSRRWICWPRFRTSTSCGSSPRRCRSTSWRPTTRPSNAR